MGEMGLAGSATLLDFDGVLVDSEPVHLAAFNDVLAGHGISISEPEYAKRYLSLDDAGVFRAVLSRGGRTLREDEVRSLVTAKAPKFMERFAGSFRTFPGAAELIARRAARGPVGIVSGALEREIEFALEGDAVVVEASIGGVTAAKRAGLRCVAVSHSYSRDELLAAGADAVVADLAGLTDSVLEGVP